ncbi:TatD family deoxyribonuclease [Patescibacteria group bacterium]|nr:MAG: TatD family deoxyribonuclease [Patescibacteria group bacterium]
MVDSHCHLYFPEFEQDRVETIERARKTGVSFFVQVGASLADSRQAVELADQYDDMVASVGIHPHCAPSPQPSPVWGEGEGEGVARLTQDVEKLKELILRNKKVVAVGECGLDFGKNGEIEDEEKKAQIALFEAQIALAQDLKLPLIIHCRNAHKETAQILQTTHYSLPTIIHCFTGTWLDAKQYLDLGCFISFSGIVSFKKKAEAIQEAAVKTPLDRLLIETDAPYLAPEPHRGKRNEPAFIGNIIQSIADLRGLSFDEIEKTTDQNARKIFG